MRYPTSIVAKFEFQLPSKIATDFSKFKDNLSALNQSNSRFRSCIRFQIK